MNRNGGRTLEALALPFPGHFRISRSEAMEHRDVRSPVALLAKAERKLRAGKVSEAMNLFEEIVESYVPSLERLAALAYLRTSERKPPRRAR